MKVITYEAVVENGQVKLPDAVRLPEQTRVYVVVPGVEGTARVRLFSRPRRWGVLKPA